ncbi:MAG TPA: hypothetical protein VM077_01105 [Candidatus Limnocylindrales bacterium]|nr:hypothetical protein [Candidatus Limnocylindrales bacterium]
MDRKYSENLIKGKITEVIFEEMFRTSNEFTIIPLGYEHTTPILAQYQHFVHVQKVLENLRNAPDFALISQDKTRVFLVEVKYRIQFDKYDIQKITNSISSAWDPCYLFIASENNFYFENTKNIANNNGEISKLSENWISNHIQEEYLFLLNEFIN